MTKSVGWLETQALSQAQSMAVYLGHLPYKVPRWNDVHAVDAQNAWVAGEQGAIMITTDGGATWIESDCTNAGEP